MGWVNKHLGRSKRSGERQLCVWAQLVFAETDDRALWCCRSPVSSIPQELCGSVRAGAGGSGWLYRGLGQGSQGSEHQLNLEITGEVRGCEDNGLQSLKWAKESIRWKNWDKSVLRTKEEQEKWHHSFVTFLLEELMWSKAVSRNTEHLGTRLMLWERVQPDPDWCCHRLRNQVHLNFKKDLLPWTPKSFAL